MQHLNVFLAAPMDSMNRAMNVGLALIIVILVSLYIIMMYSVTFVLQPISMKWELALNLALMDYTGMLLPNYV
jgi:hypothetical protein